MAVVATQVLAGANISLNHRLSVDKLTPDQLALLRQAYTKSKGINDDRGFQYWAGVHGLPLPMYCQHHTSLFLPWHRAYLYFFELSLQDQVGGITLPWWDWTSPTAGSAGLPMAYTSPTAADGSVNPLSGSPINQVARNEGAREGIPKPPTHTSRRPGPATNLPTASEIENILSATDFMDFSNRIEDVHDQIHVWIGGTVGEIPFAAYDPIFFAHHTMIDRIWYLWQLQHPTAGVPAALLPEALPPFKMTVAETLNTTTLGYDYASFTVSTSDGG